MEYIPPVFSFNAEELCRCLLSFLIIKVVASVFGITMVFKVCMSFYVFREIVELSPVDASWDYEMSCDVDGRQDVCLLIQRILLKA